jgi:PAS domain S-box-containing protein
MSGFAGGNGWGNGWGNRLRHAWRRRGLRTQIVLPLVLATLLMTALVVAVGHFRILQNAERAANTWASAMVDSAAASSVEYVLLGELERLENTLRLIAELPEVNRIEVSDQANQPLIMLTDVHTHEDGDHRHGYKPDVQIRFAQAGGLLSQFTTAGPHVLTLDGHRVLWIWRPLSTEYPAGRIGLAFDLEQRLAEGRAALHRQLAVGLGLAGIFLWLVYRVVGGTLAPVGRLAEHLRGVRNNQFRPWTEPANCREVQDITLATNGMLERLAEQIGALTASQSMLSATIDGSPYCVIVTNEHFGVTTLNAAARRQFGMAPSDMQGLGLGQLLPRVREDVFQPSVLSDWPEEARGAQTFESQGVRLSGEPFDAEISVARVVTPRAPEFVFVLRDITAENRAREALLERTARLNTVLSLSTEGIVFFNREQRLSYINPAMLDFLQPLRVEQLMGVKLAQFERMLAARSLAEHAYQPLLLKPDGTPRAAPALRSEDQPPTFTLVGSGERILTRTWKRAGRAQEELVVFFHDVTQQVTLDRTKSEFLSSAAHELRTPLTSILGFSDLMIQYPMPEADRLDLLKTIRSQSALLVNIINEMLDLSRIEARRGKDFKPQHCALAELCQEAASGMSVPGDDRVVQVVHQDPTLTIWVDPDKFRQVLNNLLSNAYKFSAGQGSVTLRTEPFQLDGSCWARVVVADEGAGMTPDQVARAFERFYRADVSGHIPGTGLGLPLVKEIVELSGGRVKLYSEPGRGTQAEVLLPLSSENPAPQDALPA